MNQTDRPTVANWQIIDGMTVYSADGYKLGTVRDYDPQAGYVDVKKGFLFTKDFYVPVTAVASVDDDSISINLTQDEVESGRYADPPQGSGDASVYSEATVADAALPDREKLGFDDEVIEEDAYTMHTADGRRI
jgi:hypothetical protein